MYISYICEVTRKVPLIGLTLMLLATSTCSAASSLHHRYSTDSSAIVRSSPPNSSVLTEAQASRQQLMKMLAMPDIKVQSSVKKTYPVKLETSPTPQVTEKVSPAMLPLDTAFKLQTLNHVYVEDIEDMNFDYIVSRTVSAMNPRQVFDDGQNTYIALKPKDQKAITDITVQYPDDIVRHMDYQEVDRFIKLKGLFKAIRITTGNRKCELINKAYYRDL